jgi:prophage DNA circulation protein
MFGFARKKEIDNLKKDARSSFDSVKKDINSINGWVNFLESEKNNHKKHIDDIKNDLSSIKEEIENLKNIVSFMGELKISQASKTRKQLFNKQTAVYPVQTAVQTAVQTPNLDHFSITERAILWILLNTDMKLSYDDVAAMLGKERSTIRGQINSIRQKSEYLIEEEIERNGKKRVFIPEEIKEKMLKRSKVRVNKDKKSKKSEE